MGTVSYGNDGVESRLDSVESKVGEQTSVLRGLFEGVTGFLNNQLKELRLIRTHQEVITGERITKDDIQRTD